MPLFLRMLKGYFKRKKLAELKQQQRNKAAFINLDRAKSIRILFETTPARLANQLQELKRMLLKSGTERAQFIAFFSDFDAKKDNVEYPVSFFHKGDFDFFFEVKNEKLQSLKSQSIDLLIDLTALRFEEASWFVLASDATTKVGISEQNQDGIWDITINKKISTPEVDLKATFDILSKLNCSLSI